MGDGGLLRRSAIGRACVAADRNAANSMLDKDAAFIESSYPVKIHDCSVEIISY